MEIKVSKEIREYKERVFFGLSTRQFICAAGSVGMAAGVYFLLKDSLNQEAISWLCLASAAPVAIAGFFRYNGMTLEKFAVAWFKSQFLRAGRRCYRAVNYCDSPLHTKERHNRKECKHVKEKASR